MNGIKRRLIAGVAVDSRHEPAANPNGLVQNHRNGRKTVGCARGIRNHLIAAPHRFMIHAVNHGLVRAGRRSRHQDPFRAVFQVPCRFLARCEQPGTLQRNVDIAPRKVFRVAHSCHPDDSASCVDSRFAGFYLSGKLAMHGIELKQVGQLIDRS